MSGSEPIPYVTRWRQSTDIWLDRLQAAMPDERVVPFGDLTAGERAQVRVAVVADPDPEELERLPVLEWVQSTWAGVERILDELPSGIGIARMVDPRLTETMSEAVLTAVLWLHRDGPRYAAQQRAQCWQHAHFLRPERRTVGVLGLGSLGAAAARRLRANGFRVLGWSRSPKPIDGVETHAEAGGLRAVLAGSDIIVNLLPHTPDTERLLDGEAFGRTRDGASLVNFGRGATVDEAALLRALDDGRLSHAFLDVFETEPLPPDHPFWTHERVTVWPHVSGPTDADSASELVASAVREWRRTGTPPPFVDRERGY